MRTDQVEVALRQRTSLEALDLGLRMVREWWRPLALTWLVYVLPFAAVVVASLREHPWWAILLLWWLRPCFDRIPLHVLSRRLFGESSGVFETGRAIPAMARSGLLTSLFVQRLSPARTFLLPVLQLEGLRGAPRRQRCAMLAKRDTGAAMALVGVGGQINAAVMLGIVLAIAMLTPGELDWSVWELFAPLLNEWNAEEGSLAVLPALYVVGMSVVEPMLVAGGFALYVNRRVYLEGWDIDLAFRRLTRRVERESSPAAPLRAAALGVFALALLLPPPASAEAPCDPEWLDSAAPCIGFILDSGDFGTMEEVTRWVPKEFEAEGPDWNIDWLPGVIASAFELILWASVASALIAIVVGIALGRHSIGPVDSEARPPLTLFGLDLDPRSLPADVVGAARDCWARGERIEALSLLYRGALIHATERGGLRIPESATEYECVRLVGSGLGLEATTLFTDLTGSWVAARYAGDPPETADFDELCRRFVPVFTVAS